MFATDTTEPADRPRMTTLSLFSGAGGLDVGLDRTGSFELLACLERDPKFCDTLRRNRDEGLFGSSSTVVLEADLSLLSPDELLDTLGVQAGQIDVIVGGPPCQSFSTAGRRRSTSDPRGTLLWDFLRFVVALRPRFFLMENVRGLLSASLHHRPIAHRPEHGGAALAPHEQPGSVVELWMADLQRLTEGDYRVDCFEVNAVNYGAPQLRERALFVGNLESKVVDFPEPTHGACNGQAAISAIALHPFATLGDALDGFCEPHPDVLDFSPRKKRYLSLVPPGGNWRALPPDVAKESMGRAYYAKGGRSGWWRRLSWDLPCPTVVTMPNHASTSMCHPDRVRALSVGECARVQGFPDGWEFAGSVQEKMAQVGNAVPARLGEVAGESLVRADRVETRSVDLQADPYRRVYLRSHVRTRQWYKSGQFFVRHRAAGEQSATVV